MVDVAHHGDDRRTDQCLVIIEVIHDVEQLEEFDLLLLTGIDHADLGAQLGGKQFDHVVGQRLGSGHHLALLHEEPDDIGRRAVHLRTQVQRGAGTFDDDLALGHCGVIWRVGRHVHRLEFFATATTTALASRRATATRATAGTTGTATRATAGTTGTATRATTGTGRTTTGTGNGFAGTATQRRTSAHRRRTGTTAGGTPGRTTSRLSSSTTTQAGRRRNRLARRRDRRSGRRRNRLPGRRERRGRTDGRHDWRVWIVHLRREIRDGGIRGPRTIVRGGRRRRCRLGSGLRLDSPLGRG